MERQTSKSSFIKVRFFEPVNGKYEYFFGSLKAIYAEFTDEEIGCSLETLYTAGIRNGNRKVTKTCTIEKHTLTRLSQTKGAITE